ncbi:MAG: polysaccharide export protein, partial [Sphingomonadaceae bacterium]
TRPGVYKFQPGARLSSALSMAEGPARVARLKQVVVFRQDEQGMSIALFDYRKVRQGTQPDPLIHPRDRIVVGISTLSQFWQDVVQTVPALALFTRI